MSHVMQFSTSTGSASADDNTYMKHNYHLAVAINSKWILEKIHIKYYSFLVEETWGSSLIWNLDSGSRL